MRHLQRSSGEDRHASACRWGVPTLLLRAPYWWQTTESPWTCVREATPRVLETTEECVACPHWEPVRPTRPATSDSAAAR